MTRSEAIEYYKGERERFEKTRAIQWKFGIGLWTLIALAIALFKKGEVFIQPSWIIIVLAYLFLFCHFLFAFYTQKGLIASRTRSNDILRSLNATQGDFVFPDVGRPPTSFTLNDWGWVFFQVLSTNVLLLVLIAIAT